MTARELLDSKKVNNHLLGMNFGSTIYLDRLMEEYAQICINKTLIAIGVNFENTLGSIPPTGKDIIWATGKVEHPTESGYYLCLTMDSGHTPGKDISTEYYCGIDCRWEISNDRKLVIRWWDLKLFK